MRKLLCVLGCVVVLGTGLKLKAQTSVPPTSITNDVGPPKDPATPDQIREYMSLIRAEKLAHEVMDSSVTAMQSTAAPYIPKSFWDDIRTELRKIDLTSAYVTVYQRYLSRDQMQAVIDFYRSPAGKNLLDAQPLAIRDAQIILKKKGEEIGQAVYERHKDEIEAAKKKYDAAQATPATK